MLGWNKLSEVQQQQQQQRPICVQRVSLKDVLFGRDTRTMKQYIAGHVLSQKYGWDIGKLSMATMTAGARVCMCVCVGNSAG